jgi:hypothetical protein
MVALGLSGAPRITQGGKPPQRVAAINPVMHQEASEEGVHLYSPRAPRETLKRGLCSLQNDYALGFVARLPREGICAKNDSACSMTIRGGIQTPCGARPYTGWSRQERETEMTLDEEERGWASPGRRVSSRRQIGR